MVVKSTYSKVLMLLISSSIFFIILYFLLYFLTLQEERNVYAETSNRFNNEINNLLELESEPIVSSLNLNTNWDEFVNFFKTKDKKWFRESIGSEIEIYQVDYLVVYDSNCKLIISTTNSKIHTLDFIPKEAILALNKSKTNKFYLRIPEGIVEVFGASIHPTKDIYKNKTNPYGYCFMIRLIDANYFQKLKKITNSDINFIENGLESLNEKSKIFDSVILKDYNNKPIGKLIFKRNFDLHFQSTKNILYIIIISFLIIMLIYLVYIKKWVYHPLDLIKKILETGNKTAIEKLKKITGEFGHIGNLFEESDNQNIELVAAKEKAEESDRLKSAFLSNLSHEIRTPMNAVIGFSNLLRSKDLNEEENLEYLDIIDKSGGDLVLIIDDLIEMSKIDAHQVEPKYKSVNIETCVRDLFETIKITIPKSKKIVFEIIENPKPPLFDIITDEVKLKQILTNLLTNAIKFTDDGSVTFGYEINKATKNIIFTVKDTGLGIDKANQKNIFDRFKRVENDIAIKVGGLGLGLAISKAYVEMLQGTIYLESNVGKGSVFTFSLPLKFDKHPRAVLEVIKNSETLDANHVGTILIAEDDNINYLLFEKIIHLKNYTILRAINGQEAVAICTNNPNIDLILMDIKMPIMSGYEALKLIQPIRPNLPIIAQTAFSSLEDKDKIFEAGFSGYITKPLNKEKLFELINQFMKK